MKTKKTAAIEISSSTEEKIKEAARRVFTQKGYAATRTRDIAEESGYNLALINYYFRSKEKLFDIIVVEQIQLFLHSVIGILDDAETSLKQKIEILIGHYVDMLLKNPYLPIFILNEVNTNPDKLVEKLGLNERPQETQLVRQWKEYAAARKGAKVDPMHLFMNVLSMTIFPFVAGPMIRNRTQTSIEQFNKLMIERKTLIPIWINAMLNI